MTMLHKIKLDFAEMKWLFWVLLCLPTLVWFSSPLLVAKFGTYRPFEPSLDFLGQFIPIFIFVNLPVAFICSALSGSHWCRRRHHTPQLIQLILAMSGMLLITLLASTFAMSFGIEIAIDHIIPRK